MATSTFWEEVYRLREESLIPRVWKRSHLMQHLDEEFKKTTIGVLPANSSISLKHSGIGDYVKGGRTPKAWRIGPPGSGKYKLVQDPEDDQKTQQEQLAKALARAKELRGTKAHGTPETVGVPAKQPSADGLSIQNDSSEDLSVKLQDVLDSMYDKRRYPLRDKARKLEYPTGPAVPPEDWYAVSGKWGELNGGS